MTTYYEHPTNGYREVGTTPFTWLWCLLFGFFFHLYKADWKGTVVNFVAAICTFGISWLVMPFFAYTFVHSAYRSRGWRQVTDAWPRAMPAPTASPAAESPMTHVRAAEQETSPWGLVMVLGMVVLIFAVAIANSGNKATTSKAEPPKFSTVVQPSKATAQTPEPFTCSKTPVPLPSHVSPASLKQCREEVRKWVRVMVANLRVTIACREEFASHPKLAHLPSAKAVTRNNAALTRMIPQIERAAEEQLRKNNTLSGCLNQLQAARQFVNLQPEFRGQWGAL